MISNKRISIILFIIVGLSLSMAVYFHMRYEKCAFAENILLGIFGSSLVSAIVSVIAFVSEMTIKHREIITAIVILQKQMLQYMDDIYNGYSTIYDLPAEVYIRYYEYVKTEVNKVKGVLEAFECQKGKESILEKWKSYSKIKLIVATYSDLANLYYELSYISKDDDELKRREKISDKYKYIIEFKKRTVAYLQEILENEYGKDFASIKGIEMK